MSTPHAQITPIRTLIVDDEPPARTRLRTLLEGRPAFEVVGVGRDGGEVVPLIHEHQPHLLFLDIEMPVLDGLSAIKLVEPRLTPLTIFVTAYDRYAIAAFEAHALDYLLKPFSDERFESALQHAVRAMPIGTSVDRHRQISGAQEDRAAGDATSGYLDRLVLKECGRVALLNVDDIDWIGAAGVYLELHAGGDTHLYRSSMSTLLSRLAPSRFVRVHRSVAVNTARIKELRARGHSDYTIVLRDGRRVPLSRAYRANIEHWLGQPLA